jgi:hypothetical protein
VKAYSAEVDGQLVERLARAEEERTDDLSPKKIT